MIQFLASPILTRVLVLSISFLVGLMIGIWSHKKISDSEISNLKLQFLELKLKSEEKIREIEHQFREKLVEAADLLNIERKKTDELTKKVNEQNARIRDLIRERDGLRDELLSYAAGDPSADTLSACQDRARTLATYVAEGAELLGSGSELLAEVAKAHDERATEVEVLLKAWPLITTK